VGAFVRELLSVSLYKRNQGRLARQATFAALAVIVALGAWSMHHYFQGAYAGGGATTAGQPTMGEQTAAARDTMLTTGQAIRVYVLPLAVLAVGLWASFRTVQFPSFADFLISVEGEMNKVSWPARGELFRASVVVMFVIFFLAAILFLYDLALTELMRGIAWFLNWIAIELVIGE
jgi:preprotein translocase subunit SecE